MSETAQAKGSAPFRSGRIAATAGGLAAALGAIVLIGWHTGGWQVVQLSPGSTPMAYNTAFCVVILGAALAALTPGSRRWAQAGASAAGLLAFARLIEYISGASLGVDQLLIRLTLHSGSLPATRMAPNTAIGFVLVASAILLLSRPRAGRWSSLAIALFGSGAIALGLNAFAGYLTGLHTFAWGGFNPMAVHTSIGFVLLGAGILAGESRNCRNDPGGRPSWLLVVTVTAGIVTSISLWQAVAFLERANRNSAIRLESNMPAAVLLAGLGFTALLGLAVQLAKTAWIRTRLSEQMRAQVEREIAERKLAAEAARASERTYRTLLESLPQKILYKNRDSIYRSCNENFARDLHTTPADIEGKTDYDFFPKDLAEKYRAEDQRVMDTGKAAEIEAEYLQEGQKQFVQIAKIPVRDDSGSIIGIVVIFWDITDRKRAADAMRWASLYNQSLIEASLDPLVTISKNGKITDVNLATENVTGFPRQALIGTDFSNYFTEPHKAREGYQQVFREGLAQNYELAIRRRDGRVTPVLYNATLYRDESGEGIGVFAAARDITDRKRAEEALEQNIRELARSNADLEQFAYVASHDLQEPLRMVANFTQLLAERYRDQVGEDGAEFIRYAVDGATRMQRLIEDLLRYSRVGTRGKSFQPTDCNEVLGHAVANLQVSIGDSGALVTHDELPTLMGDSSQLTQVFQNLVGNAIKFRSEAAPRIHVFAVRRSGNWIFSVRDNGIGIDPQFAERIFVIFQRLHSRGKYPGTGIGLAVCKKIVERHGGKIWVESEPGKGAAFLFSIPAH